MANLAPGEEPLAQLTQVRKNSIAISNQSEVTRISHGRSVASIARKRRRRTTLLIQQRNTSIVTVANIRNTGEANPGRED